MTSEQPEETAEDDLQAPEVEGDVEVEGQDVDDEKLGGREARYRRQLRDTQAELALARVLLDDARTREVERLATGLADPADLWTLTASAVEDYVGEDGTVDPARVTAAVASIIATRPGLARNQKAIDPYQGRGNESSTAPTWSGLLGPD